MLHSGEGVAEVVDRFDPHVVLLDIGLPGKDGYEIARQLRGLERGRSLVIAAVTGYGRDEDRRRAEEAGFDYHFVKPIDFERLKTICRRRAARSTTARIGAGDQPAVEENAGIQPR